MNNDKGLEIFVTAIMKSVIESGAPTDEWEAKVRLGCKIVTGIVNAVRAKETAQ